MLARSGVVVGKNQSFSHKKKANKIVPRIAEKSKVISKGRGYQERKGKREKDFVAAGSSKSLGRAHGCNNLRAKKLNEGKFLSAVNGIALTQAQKKKLAKKQKRLLSQSMVEVESSGHSASNDVPEDQ